MSHPPEKVTSQKSTEQPTRRLPPWWAFGCALAAALVIYAVVVPTEVSPPVPKVDYRALIAVETGKAKNQTDAILKGHQASLERINQSYTIRFSSSATSAAKEAAAYTSILKIIGYLALDLAQGTNDAESYMSTLIGPSITPVLSDFHNELNAESAKYDYELRKVTVQLAGNVAAMGPGNVPPPPRLDSPESTSREFQKVLTALGWKGIFASADIGLTLSDLSGKRILSKLIRPMGAIAARMFGKQIAKVAALPVIALATGPIPIGSIIAGANAVWTVYDVYSLSPDFQDEVDQNLQTHLNEVRTNAKSQLSKSASIKSDEVKKIQLDIGARALDDFTKQDAK